MGLIPSSRLDLLERLARLLVAVVGSLYVTWPMAAPGWFSTNRDALYGLLSMEQVQESLLGGTPLFDGPLMYPLPSSLTFADVVLGQGVMGLPLRLAALDPLWAHNLVLVSGVAMTAWALMAVARQLVGPGPHTWWAAFGAWGPAHLVHLQHINLMHHQWGVLAALLAGWGLARHRPDGTGLVGPLLAVGVTFGGYVGMHGGWMVAATMLVAAVARIGDRRSWAALVVGLAVAAAAVWPLLTVYGETAARFALWSTMEEAQLESWDLANTLAPVRQVSLHSMLTRRGVVTDPINPGYAVALLSLVGMWAVGRPCRARWGAWAVVLVGAGAGVLALGPELMIGGHSTGVPMPYALVSQLPGFRGLRAPARWFAVTSMALAIGASYGSAVLWRGVRDRGAPARLGLAAVLVVLGLAEAPRQNPLDPVSPTFDVPDIYLLLDDIPGRGAIYDEALLARRTLGCGPLCGLRASMYHERPVLFGAAARWFDEVREVSQLAQRWPEQESLELFGLLDVRLVVDGEPLANMSGRSWARCSVDGGLQICALDLPERAPLPPPEAVSEVPDGPILGLRWPESIVTPSFIHTRCGRQPPQAHRVRVHRAVSGLRHGPEAPLDVFLAHPCASVVDTDLAGAVPLYRRPGTEDLTWGPELAPRTRRVSDAAALQRKY